MSCCIFGVILIDPVQLVFIVGDVGLGWAKLCGNSAVSIIQTAAIKRTIRDNSNEHAIFTAKFFLSLKDSEEI
jgi:hypothetical protein